MQALGYKYILCPGLSGAIILLICQTILLEVLVLPSHNTVPLDFFLANSHHPNLFSFHFLPKGSAAAVLYPSLPAKTCLKQVNKAVSKAKKA